MFKVAGDLRKVAVRKRRLAGGGLASQIVGKKT